jgi:NAD(P)-dependent dehydrogenase (short-subunit alcohol dehydrogenase family)
VITHGADGIGVSVVCPQYVATPLIGLSTEDAKDQASLLTADQVASCVLDGLADDKFLIMTHPEAAKFAAFRGSDHDHWIAGMQKFQAVAKSTLGEVTPSLMYKLM